MENDQGSFEFIVIIYAVTDFKIITLWYTQVILQIIRFLRRDLLFKPSNHFKHPNNLIAMLWQPEAMWCQVLHRQEPLTFSSKNVIYFYYDAILLVSLTPFVPGLILKALSNSKVLFIGLIY